jgi:hypothetical protein
MTLPTKLRIAATVVVVLGAGAVGIAQAGRGSDDASGPEAGKAKQAALKVVAGRVVAIEREDDGRKGWEVEIVKADGHQVEVHVTPTFASAGVESDDDDAGKTHGDADEKDDDGDDRRGAKKKHDADDRDDVKKKPAAKHKDDD